MKNAVFLLLMLGLFAFAGIVCTTGKFSENKANAIRLSDKKNANYLLYVTGMPEFDLPEDVRIVDFGFAIEMKSSTIFSVKDQNTVLGFSVEFEGNEVDLNKLLNEIGVRIQKRYFVGEVQVIEGEIQTGFLSKTRVQVAFCAKKITVGFPVIFGSF